MFSNILQPSRPLAIFSRVVKGELSSMKRVSFLIKKKFRRIKQMFRTSFYWFFHVARRVVVRTAEGHNMTAGIRRRKGDRWKNVVLFTLDVWARMSRRLISDEDSKFSVLSLTSVSISASMGKQWAFFLKPFGHFFNKLFSYKY